MHSPRWSSDTRRSTRRTSRRARTSRSITSRCATTLVDFVAAEDGEYLKWAEAVFRIFDRQACLRVNRARARIKVLVDKVGIDEVRRMVDEELEGDWVHERDFAPDPLLFEDDEQSSAPAPPETYATPNGDVSEFERFRRSNFT